MKTYTINNKKYYLGDDIKTTYAKLFKGCKNVREFVKQNNIPSAKYRFAKLNNKKWVKSNGTSYKFDKVFLLKSWMDKKYLNDNVESYIDDTLDAPRIIELDDEEKFTDSDGSVLDIEVRGERECDKCYFKVGDVMEGFDMPNLHDALKNKRNRGYVHNIHYVYFYIPIINRNKKIKKLFLTYTGLLRVLFVSRNDKTNKFVDWATKTLFTAQMGTKTQKTELVSNILGVSTESVKSVFDKTSRDIPCIYLFSIGKVSDLRELLDINEEYDDNEYVYKWGRTDDLKRRIKEHEKTFSKKEGFDLQLVLFNNIDPQFVSEAETNITHYMEDMNFKLKHDIFRELAIIPKNRMKRTKEHYKLVSDNYAGHYTELLQRIKIMEEKHARELLQKDNELLKKDKELLERDVKYLKHTNSKKNLKQS